MDWLDETIEAYEKKKNAEKIAGAEQQKKREEESNKHRKAVTEVLSSAHNKLQNIKTKLIARNYQCDVKVDSLVDPNTAEQFVREITFLVQNETPRRGEKLDKLNSSSLVISVDYSWDQFRITTKDIRFQREAPRSLPQKSDMLTDAFIDDVIQKFIKQIFS